MRYLRVVTILLTLLIVAGNVALTLKNTAADHTAPVISMESEQLELSIEAKPEEYLQGVTAQDRRDGDLTGQIVLEHLSQLINENSVKATYAVFDQAGNAATATRTIVYTDYTGPYFTVSQPLRYHVAAVVTLMDRVAAIDPYDGVITARIRATNINLNNDTEGIYHIQLQVTNSLGDTVTQTLPVIIANDTGETPQILLSTYLDYVEQNAQFDPENYIVSVTDPALPEELQPEKTTVEIDSNIDSSVPGTYEITYTYEGEEDDTFVILTVVVKDREEAQS